MVKLTPEQVAALPKEKKIAYLDALKEKKRRKGALKPKYVPNEGQLRVHKSQAVERYVFFGNGSGKTTLLAHEMHWAATGFNPISGEYFKVPRAIVVVVDNPDKIGMRLIPELKAWYEIQDKWMSQEGKPHISLIKYPNGSTVKFLSHDIDPLKAEGIELDDLLCDEPLPQHLYNALTRGMRKKGSGKKRTLIVGTPLAEPWLRTEVFDPWKKGELPYVECFTGSSEMNKANVDWERQEKWLARLSPSERKARLEGSFLDLSGSALAHLWRPEKHLIERFPWPKNWPCVIAIDPAQSKPHVAVLVGSDLRGRLYYIDEFSLRAPAREFARELRARWLSTYPVVDIVCDSLGSSGQTGGEGLSSFIEVINDEGVRARATTYADKSDEVWIDGIQNALFIDPKDEIGATPRLRIFKGNSFIVSDIENVSWVKIRHTETFKNKLDISKKDYLACLKYVLASFGDSGVHSVVQSTGYTRRLGDGSGFSWKDREKY